MLTAHTLSKAFGLTPILKNITFSINAGARVGLIGPNGCGKTTLLRLLTGEESPDTGHVALTPSNLQIGYLAQGFEPDPALSLGQLIHQTVGDPARLEVELAQLGTALAAEPERADLQAAYDQTLTRLSRSNIGQFQSILAGLGLDVIDEAQLVATLSGGQKTRLALALVLLSDPQLLLLDEPTNHLDIEMLEWLESWLVGFPGGALIVSHDRTFLDRTVTRILDLNPQTQTIREYAGNYTDYLEQYVQEQEKQLAEWKDQQYEIRRMKQDIARMKEQAANKERRVKSVSVGGIKEGKDHYLRLAKKVAQKGKSREKKLDRYLDSDERVEKPKASWQMKLDFDDVAHLGRDVLTIEDLTIGYSPDAPLLRELNLQVQSGQRVLLTGMNGTGKSTLLRTIVGEIRPLTGHYHLGSSVKLGYMAQEQELLDPASTALEIIRQTAPLNQTDARSFLHYFLFSGDDPLRPIGQLSYGERARLSLALLVAQGCNFLLLDEPINHLDIPSRSQFEQALTQFEGTVLAVVHDRYFIERFATDVWQVAGNGIEQQILRWVEE
ncbi:MAG: ABC-F family ATP-binding cassette domain-containing protein [Ardenticatenaceae bacterium]|nr:ABC-F family ATP-binding cassette domain-containing protein [Ardenticatenaceae bacterium]MCB9443506.1 ABC-F family ATP-binding cassette domain-containing protein [Ardenticatenaceae bacterium]